MLKSLRNVARTLLTLGVLAFSLTMLSSVTVECAEGESGCLASVLTASFTTPEYTLEQPVMTAETTPTYQFGAGMTLAEFNTVVQLVSAYALLIAVLVLITLECVELKYMRQFLHFKRRAR